MTSNMHDNHQLFTNSSLNVTNIYSSVLSHPAIFGFRAMFYVVTPAESSFPKILDVPHYVDKAVPFFIIMIIIETILLILKGRKRSILQYNDAFSSIAARLVSVLPHLFVKNVEIVAYIWVYENYHVFELPWDSPWTWLLAMLGVDLGFYWVHRAAHEVNFLWAGHQTHHSSEYYNLTTALRQGIFQKYGSWVFYLPLASCVPPSVFMVHIQFNSLYQFWIHTEVVRKLGPLELVLNTPSHHRVHHGRNRYCIDKNYAGVFIIWDRMFGTFEPESDEVVYGLVHTLNSWNPIYTQTCHWQHILKTAWQTEGLGNKLAIFFKGPSWQQGKPRLGLLTDRPDVHAPMPKYGQRLSIWFNLYCWLHFAVALLLHDAVNAQNREGKLSAINAVIVLLFTLWTITNIGFIFDRKPYAIHMELFRCCTCLFFDAIFIAHSQPSSSILYFLRVLFSASAFLWLTFAFEFTTEVKNKKKRL